MRPSSADNRSGNLDLVDRQATREIAGRRASPEEELIVLDEEEAELSASRGGGSSLLNYRKVGSLLP
jgi:hypothetical protein